MANISSRNFSANIFKSLISARCGKNAILVVAFAIGMIAPAAPQSTDGKPSPQLLYMKRSGLDVRHNRIDKLISIYGFICIRSTIYPMPPCRIDSELVAYLKTLPPSQPDIDRELTTLGAVCKQKDERLDCVYERKVENSYWVTGASEPETVVEEHLRIDFGVVKNQSSLNYEARFDRTGRVKRRRSGGKNI